MYTSVRWLNDYLDPPATAEEQAEAATHAGFPLEDGEDVKVSDGTDRRQDYEMTSNRGDCVSHVGLAREIAAITGRTLKAPQPKLRTSGGRSSDVVTVTNREPDRCPLYTARIIKGAKVGPSPTWLADRLLARGDIPRNNVVDATNFVLFEMGQPTHVFDLAMLEGPEIIVRMAEAGEPFLPIGEGEAEVKLTTDDLVIADARRAVAIAGVKGGAVTAVSDGTTDLLLEAASFNPVCVRNSSRRLAIASDSSYRFERGVHPGQVDAAAERLAELILETAGGELLDGSVYDGAPIPEAGTATMRPDRCRKILGVPVTDDDMLAVLARLGYEPTRTGDHITCRVPVYRLDIDREIDLIEEVGRMYGLEKIPVQETMEVRVVAPQATELARQAVSSELVGMGFVETVTHSLVSNEAATPFLPAGTRALRVDDDRAKAEPVLQPSVMPSLLRVRAHNQDAGVGPLRLFEAAATFRDTDDGHGEAIRLGLLMDAPDDDEALRPVRGVIQRMAEVLRGHAARVEVEPDTTTAWLAPGAKASVDGHTLGVFGRLAPDVAKIFGLDEPLLAAELDLVALYEQYPPENVAHALPSFPAIERDLSIVVADSVAWATIAQRIDELKLDHLEDCGFITTFRGRQIPAGSRSLTMRLRFRCPDRTLRHAEVDPQMESVIAAMRDSFGAEIRD
ncbi:MAG: phenylalanine--tRNA ligase subunit beta [Planctomycetes bacterium]|nr:phenylalanine--tRNA ligase subunit beta [Planctomycetota bacterium]